MKKLLLGSFVALISLTAGAVINEKTNSQATSFYGNTGSGFYILIDLADPSNCYSSDSNPCMYSSATSTVSTFTIGTPGQPFDLQQVGSDERLYGFN